MHINSPHGIKIRPSAIEVFEKLLLFQYINILKNFDMSKLE